MEIEAKYGVPDAATWNGLRQAERLADFDLGTGATHQDHDVYLDTRDRALLVAGYTCRRRERQGQIVLTVKEIAAPSGAIHRRAEYELTLPGDRPPAEWDAGPARDLVLRIAGAEPLEPLFALEQNRTVRPVTCAARAIADLSLDEVRIAARDKRAHFLALEVELSSQGTEEDLAQIAAHLQDDWKLVPDPRSKFARALALAEGFLNAGEREELERIAAQPNARSRRARALLALDEGENEDQAALRAGFSVRRVRYWRTAFERRRLLIMAAPDRYPATPAPDSSDKPSAPHRESPGLTREDSMAEAARKTLWFHFQRMLDHEAGARAGEDPEELHDMRVATRRMRAARLVFEGYVDPASMRPFAKALRRTGRLLGAVRDLDVFRDKTQQYLTTLPDDRQGELDLLLAAWKMEYDRARGQLIAYLDGDAYATFRDEFDTWLQTPGSGALSPLGEAGEPRPYRVRHALPVILAQGLAAIRAYDEWVTGGDTPLERLHQLRIAGKRLRYALEFFTEVLPPQADPVIEQIKSLQDLLGDLQDSVVACGILRDFLMWGHWRPVGEGKPPVQVVVAPGVARYLAARQAEIAECLRAFTPHWAQIDGDEFKRDWAALVNGW